MGNYDVFISYRRGDCSDRAPLIRSYLANWFDQERIFLDTHEIHEGPFPQYIEEALNSAKYFIVLISNKSFVGAPPSGKTDYYYEEIRRAIAKGLKIIPIIYDQLYFDGLEMPDDISSIKLQNAIYAHSDDPQGLKNRLYEFTKKKERRLKDWIAFPLAVITIYLFVSLLSGIGMYAYDYFCTSYADAVEIAADHMVQYDDEFYYQISDNTTVRYSPQTQKITRLSMGAESDFSIAISKQAVYKIGFWSTATALFYQIVKSKYKPHNGKQLIAYIGAAVAVFAGIGLGCTVERMIFPIYRTNKIEDNIYNQRFWQDAISEKFKESHQHIFVE